MKNLFGIFVILHGLVHIWYVVLSQNLVEFKPDMGWTGESWLFTNLLGGPITRLAASICYALAAILFVISGIALISQAHWWRSVIITSAVFSAIVILLFWDGNSQLLIQKGILGLLINIGILFLVLVLKLPGI